MAIILRLARYFALRCMTRGLLKKQLNCCKVVLFWESRCSPTKHTYPTSYASLEMHISRAWMCYVSLTSNSDFLYPI